MPTLGYWKIRGLAHPIRMLLSYAQVDFEDVQYEQGDGPDFSREAWTKVKHTLGLSFPNLPYYIDGDVKLTQSNAILRHIARNHKLYGTTEQEMSNADLILEEAMDLRNRVVRMVYNPEYKTLLEKYKTGPLPELLRGFEDRLSDKNWFAGGDNVTVADFPMYELLDQHRLMIDGCLTGYPKLTEFMKRFEGLPKMKEFFAKRKCELPVNNKVAQFK